jgi:hypothetical protein
MSPIAADPIMALPPEQRLQAWADKAWPLRFQLYSFGARAYNVQRASILFDRDQFGPTEELYDKATGRSTEILQPSGPPPYSDWKDRWSGSYLYIPEEHDGKMFSTPVDIDWVSLDGAEHTTSIDLDAIFPERLVLHNAKREQIPLAYLVPSGKGDERLSVDILLEVNDRTINVYSKALIVVGDPQDVDNIDKRRMLTDLILAWTKTY